MGTKFVQFLATLTVLPRSIWKKRLNSTRNTGGLELINCRFLYFLNWINYPIERKEQLCLELINVYNDYRVSCDADSWILDVNKKILFPFYSHIIPLYDISNVQIGGDVRVRSVNCWQPSGQRWAQINFNY